MWYPDPALTRVQHDRELRMLYACLGVSIALHGLAMLSFPAFRPGERFDETKALTALLAFAPEPAAVAPAPVPRKPRERREAERQPPLAKHVDPAPVAAPVAEAAPPAPAPAESSPVATAPAPVPVTAPAAPAAEPVDPNLFEAYRLALIDAAKRYKRYPAQAVDRGWEGRVEIRIVVDANGTIKSAMVKNSSRYQILDNQALEMVRRAFNDVARAAPRGREFTVDVPVVFELQTG